MSNGDWHTGVHTHRDVHKNQPPRHNNIRTEQKENLQLRSHSVSFVFFPLLSLSVVLPQFLSVHMTLPTPTPQYNDIDTTSAEEPFGCVPAHRGSEVWVSLCALSTASASQSTFWLCSFKHHSEICLHHEQSQGRISQRRKKKLYAVVNHLIKV